MSTPLRVMLAAFTLVLATASPIASQDYECTTTTITTTIYHHDVFGNYYITTVTRTSTVCKPLII